MRWCATHFWDLGVLPEYITLFLAQPNAEPITINRIFLLT